MKFLTQSLGALIEAWSEVKVQRARVIMSLIGVVAAVTAVTVVVAMLNIGQQANKEQQESYSGRETTLTVTAFQEEDSDANGSAVSMFGYSGPIAPAQETTDNESADSGWSAAETGVANDPLGSHMADVAKRYEIPYWTRRQLTSGINVVEYQQALQTGQFRGREVPVDDLGAPEQAEIYAVDPAYSTIFRTRIVHGRWLNSADFDARLTPVVISEGFWKKLGKPNIYDPIIFNLELPGSKTSQTVQVRVVGVAKGGTPYDFPRIYALYDSWQLTNTAATDTQGQTEMLVWVSDEQIQIAREMLPKALAAMLGDGWSTSVSGGEAEWEDADTGLDTAQIMVLAIGGIIIFLGALSLLNVAVVTVKQRIREIGIRRAMGASATRVFFAVFMESVVATLVAGIIGVGLAIIVLKFMPLEKMGIFLQDPPAFPVSAAIFGVGISAAVGALCGIIPAVAAVRVRPIEAIRN